jgi:hypothetical protein
MNNLLGIEKFEEVYDELKEKMAEKLWIELINANRTGTMEEYVIHLNLDELCKKKKKSILVLGYSQMSKADIRNLCALYDYEKIEILKTEEELKQFDCSTLKNNSYSTVIIGEAPHKLRNIKGSNNNLWREVEQHPDIYKNCYLAKSGEVIHLTKNSIDNVLQSIQLQN